MNKNRILLLLLGLSLLLFAAGCKKKAPAPPPPPPPPPPPVKEVPKAPSIVSFSANPSTIERGSSSTLRWEVDNATDVSINQGIGTVPANGSRQVFPNGNTTYTLTAKGEGGSTDRDVTVTVTVPPPPPPPAPKAPEKTFEEWVAQLEDAYFDYDKSDIREDARAALTRDADLIKTILDKFPSGTLVIEGHCDERGSAEYNLGLGDRRATSGKEFLEQLGIQADKLRTISYGKERPQCTESTEECWQKNRRVHFSVGQ